MNAIDLAHAVESEARTRLLALAAIALWAITLTGFGETVTGAVTTLAADTGRWLLDVLLDWWVLR